MSNTSAIVFSHERTTMAHARPPASGGRPVPILRALDYVPPGIMSDPAWFLDKAADILVDREGVVLTQHVPLYEWGNDKRPFRDQISEFASKAGHGGWWSAQAAVDRGSGWITLSHTATKSRIHLGIMSQLDQEQVPLFDLGWGPDIIAGQLAIFHAAVGVPYRATPGVSGCAAIRRWHERKAVREGSEREIPAWVWREAPDDILPPRDVMWSRPLTDVEKRCRWVHAFDTNKQYLAAMANVPLSWALPTPGGGCEFDAGRAGMWRVVARGSGDRHPGDMPALIDPGSIGGSGSAWVDTSILGEFHRRGVRLEIIDSWLSPAKRRERRDGTEVPGAGRLLRGPAEMFRDAQYANRAVDSHRDGCPCPRCRMAATLKMVPNHAIGMLAAPGSTMRRLDWHYGIRGMARMLLLIKIYKAAEVHGLKPIKVERDCVWYASDDPDPMGVGSRLGVVRNGQIGRLKIEKSKCVTMHDYLEQQHTAAQQRRDRKRVS